jgi:MoaA/NifB/PqqE/SkfB family radical SAM enzyme
MTLERIEKILDQAEDLGTVDWVYFEGGEPFLYYPILVRGVSSAAERGFKVGVVSNAYWAVADRDAHEWLRPLAGKTEDLGISSDLFHGDEKLSEQARTAQEIAERLEIPSGILTIARPEETCVAGTRGQIPPGEYPVMYRGRAAETLAPSAPRHPWTDFTECPHEDLREPGRVHVDPFGNVHACHGISLGNVFETPLRKICAGYDPDRHPITGPLLEGGPVALARRYRVEHEEGYADACHLCDATRRALRGRFPDILTPDQVYGIEKNASD